MKVVLTFVLREQVHADGDALGDSLITLFGVALVEGHHAALVQGLVEVGQRPLKRVAACQALAQGRARQFEHERPLAQAARQCPERLQVVGWRFQPGGEHLHRLVGGHLVHVHSPGLGGYGELTSGDQAGATFAPAQEGTQVNRVPHVIYDNQAILVTQTFRQSSGSVFLRGETGPLARQRRVEGGQRGHHVGRLAQRHPQDAVVKGGHHVVVVAQGSSQRGFARTTGTVQGCGDGDRVLALFVQQVSDQLPELCWPLDKALRQVGGHEGHARYLTRAFEVADEGLPLAVQVVEMRITHPAWQAFELEIGRAFHRIDAHALLPGIAPLLAHDLGLYGVRGHDQHHELHGIERIGDLFPPATAAFHSGAVLPEGDLRLLALETFAKPCGEFLSIGAAIGNKDPRFVSHRQLLSCDIRLHEWMSGRATPGVKRYAEQVLPLRGDDC